MCGEGEVAYICIDIRKIVDSKIIAGLSISVNLKSPWVGTGTTYTNWLRCYASNDGQQAHLVEPGRIPFTGIEVWSTITLIRVECPLHARITTCCGIWRW